MRKLYTKSWLFSLLALLSVTLLFLPQLAFAQTGAAVCSPFPMCLWLNVLSFTPPTTDVSVRLLSHIFGSIPNVLYGPPSTIIGNLFGIFNNAIGGLIGLVVIYTTTRAIFDTAQDGTPLGKKFTSMHVLRTVAGMGLIVPTNTGYSVIQIIVMWVTLQGVGLADSVWHGTLTYLQQGNPFYISTVSGPTDSQTPEQYAPISGTTITGTTDSEETKDSQVVGASGVLRSLVCMHTLTNTLNKYQATIKTNMDLGLISPEQKQNAQAIINAYFSLRPGYDTKTYVAYFPNTKDTDNVADINIAALNGICGTYRWGWDQTGEANAIWLQDRGSYIPAKYNALHQMVSYLDPIAEEIVKNSEYLTDIDIATRTLNTAVNYESALYIIRKFAGPDKNYTPPPKTSTANQIPDIVYTTAIEQGWATAGSYYYTIAKARADASRKLESNNYLLTAKDPQYNLVGAPFPSTSDQISSNDKLNAFFKQYDDNNNQKRVFINNLYKISDTTKQAVTLADQLNEKFQSGDTYAGLQGMDDLKNFIHQISLINPATIPTPLGIQLPGLGSPSGGACLIDIKKGLLKGLKAFCISAQGKAIPSYNLDPAAVIFLPAFNSVRNILLDWQSIMIGNCLDNAATARTGKACSTPNVQPVPQPIEKLKVLGDTMMLNVIDAFLKMASNLRNTILIIFGIQVGAGAISTALSLIPTVSGLGATVSMFVAGLLNTFMAYFVMSAAILAPLVLAILGPMFMLGVTLSIYVPLIPYLLFTFGVISWLTFVIEAMAGAPLIALGITHPEGHDLLGKSDQAMMLLFSVFLRPVSMIIGLITAMVFSYVSLDLVNITFSYIMGSTGFFGDASIPTKFTDHLGVLGAFLGYTLSEGDIGSTVSGFHGGSGIQFIAATALTPTVIMAIIKYCFTMIIYTYLAMTIVNQSFSLIYVIPEKIGRWIGLHPEPSDALRLLQEVKGGIDTFGQAMGEAGKGVVSGMGGKLPSAKFKGLAVKKGPDKGGAETGVNPPPKGGGIAGKP